MNVSQGARCTHCFAAQTDAPSTHAQHKWRSLQNGVPCKMQDRLFAHQWPASRHSQCLLPPPLPAPVRPPSPPLPAHRMDPGSWNSLPDTFLGLPSSPPLAGPRSLSPRSRARGPTVEPGPEAMPTAKPEVGGPPAPLPAAEGGSAMEKPGKEGAARHNDAAAAAGQTTMQQVEDRSREATEAALFNTWWPLRMADGRGRGRLGGRWPVPQRALGHACMHREMWLTNKKQHSPPDKPALVYFRRHYGVSFSELRTSLYV